MAEVCEVLSHPIFRNVGRNDDTLRRPPLTISSGLERQPCCAVALDNYAATEDVEFHSGGGAAASRLTDRD